MKQTTAYAILGLLSLKPQSGYEIKQNIEKSVGFFWQESYGQLYPNLKKLSEKKEIKIVSSQSGQERNKTVYSITALGRKRLKSWLQEPVETLPKVRNELLLKLFFSTNVAEKDARKHLLDYKQQIEEMRERFAKIEKTVEHMARTDKKVKYQYITLLNGICSCEAELKWCDQSLALLSETV